MVSLKRSLLFTLLLLTGQQLLAQPSNRTAVTSGKSIVKKESPSELGWSGSVSYGASTNLAATGEKRKYSHGLSIGVAYSITKQIGASFGGGISWKAEGQNINKQNENPSWDDLSLGIGYGDDITNTMSYSLGLGTGFPTSYESNLEEIKGTINANSGLSMTFLEKTISWSNSLSFTKYFQTYDYSIVSGELNVDTNLSFSTNISYKFGGGFSTGVGYSTWTTRLVNGETTNGISFKSSSGFSLGYTYKKYTFSAGYSVGNYDDKDGYQPMMYDETKRSLRAGVGVAF